MRKSLPAEDKQSLFDFDGRNNILSEEHLGIINGAITANVLYRDIVSFKKMMAPPFASSDFLFEGRFYGKKLKTDTYSWKPYCVERCAVMNGIRIVGRLFAVLSTRSLIQSITVQNISQNSKKIPLSFKMSGNLDYIKFWGFAAPSSLKGCQTLTDACPNGLSYYFSFDKALLSGRKIIMENDAGAMVIGSDSEILRWQNNNWEGTLRLNPREERSINFVFSIGDRKAANDLSNAYMGREKELYRQTATHWLAKERDLYSRLPSFESDNPGLNLFYQRSLSHFLLNKWDVNEFVLKPYYGAGSINGGCVCNYLWNFGETWEIFPLHDPASLRAHIKHFLSIDLTRHFAFTPVTGEAYGPWYPVNQEKIIFLIYYHVLHTGDIRFLDEKVNNRSVLDWVIFHATLRDDLTRKAMLVDYGNGNNHLELRGKYRYDNILPDLNARRCANYMAVYALCSMAGKGMKYSFLHRRATGLKRLILSTLWSKKHGWFYFIDSKRRKQLRYTVQMFKLLGGGVLDKAQEDGLVSHLNDREFLSEYGLHSMSKKDPAYDQADIDNGGGGCCTPFVPQIIERLYKINRVAIADDMFRHILWWAEKMPYWGDSMVANHPDYRRDTPLVCDVGSVAGAQSIIFGLFGIRVMETGRLVISPRPSLLARKFHLKNVRIRGHVFDVLLTNNRFAVRTKKRLVHSTTGNPVVL